MAAIETAPNIGKVLGQRLRQVGIETRETLDGLGEDAVFSASSPPSPMMPAAIPGAQ